jgi:hypothetical protein
MGMPLGLPLKARRRFIPCRPYIHPAQRYCRGEREGSLKNDKDKDLQMNAPRHNFYTNDVSPEFLRRLDEPHFTEERLSPFCDGAWAVVRQQGAHQ